MKQITTVFLLGTLLCFGSTFSKKFSHGVENDTFKNICYDGKDPKGWDTKTKLTNFAAGPCDPAILLAGIGGSTLQVMIDCQALQSGDPKTFATCGWNGCGAKDKKPNPEYQIWVPSFDAPMSVLNPEEIKKDCFAAIFGMDYDLTTTTVTPKPKPGITIKATGTTPETQTFAQSGCGDAGV
jgi:lecithin-cholesterol acyltransferase